MQIDTSNWYDGEVRAEDAPAQIRDAFAMIRNESIATIEGESCCSSCASHALAEATEGTPAEGYAFYHEQDVERGYDQLYIGFWSVSDIDEDTEWVAKQIVRAFEEHGFDVDWDGDINRKIRVES